MNGDTMTATARVLIWVFFLLIATKVVEFLALHGSPIRPIFVYAPLVGVALIVVALCVGRSDTPRIPKAEAYFFFVNLLLAVWILVSPGGYSDYSFRIAMWPLINLLMGGALFYFARYMGLGSTIVNAAIGALVVELLGILADLWMPGTFAEWAARPAGPPQNSNNAGLLVCLLLALLLPVTRGEPVRPASLLALAVSVVGVFVSLSRSGLLMCLGIAVLFIVALARSPMRPRFQRPLFEVCASTVLAMVVGTLLFAPALREPDAIAIWRSKIGVAIPDLTLKISGGASKTSVRYHRTIKYDYSIAGITRHIDPRDGRHNSPKRKCFQIFLGRSQTTSAARIGNWLWLSLQKRPTQHVSESLRRTRCACGADVFFRPVAADPRCGSSTIDRTSRGCQHRVGQLDAISHTAGRTLVPRLRLRHARSHCAGPVATQVAVRHCCKFAAAIIQLGHRTQVAGQQSGRALKC